MKRGGYVLVRIGKGKAKTISRTIERKTRVLRAKKRKT